MAEKGPDSRLGDGADPCKLSSRSEISFRSDERGRLLTEVYDELLDLQRYFRVLKS